MSRPHLRSRCVLLADKETRFRELSAAELQPMAGLLSLIRTVQKSGVLLAAVTNAPRPNVKFMLSLFGMASEEHPISHQGSSGQHGHFDTVVLGEDCTEAKPSPVPYQLAMERLGVRPEECIVFEGQRERSHCGRAGRLCGGRRPHHQDRRADAGAGLRLRHTRLHADRRRQDDARHEGFRTRLSWSDFHCSLSSATAAAARESDPHSGRRRRVQYIE